jgi:hypothetical protein
MCLSGGMPHQCYRCLVSLLLLLGPYEARFFASKMWYGEQWYMQTDAHMTFAQDWDATSVKMLLAAPSKKPVSLRDVPVDVFGRTACLEACLTSIMPHAAAFPILCAFI